MSIDNWVDIVVGLFAGGLIGTWIKSWFDHRAAKAMDATTKDRDEDADWRAFVNEQREMFTKAAEQQRAAFDIVIAHLNGRITALETSQAALKVDFDAEQRVLAVALAHLRELRSWIEGGAHGLMPPLPSTLEGRI